MVAQGILVQKLTSSKGSLPIAHTIIASFTD